MVQQVYTPTFNFFEEIKDLTHKCYWMYMKHAFHCKLLDRKLQATCSLH